MTCINVFIGIVICSIAVAAIIIVVSMREIINHNAGNNYDYRLTEALTK